MMTMRNKKFMPVSEFDGARLRRKSSGRSPRADKFSAKTTFSLVAIGFAVAVMSTDSSAQPSSFEEGKANAMPGTLPHWEDLPDWSGVWAEVGNTVFDHESVEPPGGSSNEPGTREYPPLTEEWEEVYEENLALVAEGRFPDPITNCGVPVGFPRIFNLPDVYEFVVRPEQTWILTENGPNVMRIYTDGRGHPAPGNIWLTYTGDSVGYWDGQTLVFSTIAVMNEGTILDRTGLTLSNEMTAVTRMQEVEDGRIEVEMTLRDPIALAEPWTVTSEFERLPEGTRVYDYACAENNRNPVTDSGQTITLGPEGEVLDDLDE